MGNPRDEEALMVLRDRQDEHYRMLNESLQQMKAKVMELEEDALLMRAFKRQIKGVDIRIIVDGYIGSGHRQGIDQVISRIKLEANQGY